MAQRPPARRLTCPNAGAAVPVPYLVWTRYGDDCYQAEPLPGYRFVVMPDPAFQGGWVFHLPGKTATPATRREIAIRACEHWWFSAMAAFLNPQAAQAAS